MAPIKNIIKAVETVKKYLPYPIIITRKDLEIIFNLNYHNADALYKSYRKQLNKTEFHVLSVYEVAEISSLKVEDILKSLGRIKNTF